jgi:hypothetical protein
MRSIALDVHRDFCEVAIKDGGEVRSAGRLKTTAEELERFARTPGRSASCLTPGFCPRSGGSGAHAGAAAPGGAPRRARSPAHPGEERAPRGAGPQPQAQTAPRYSGALVRYHRHRRSN